MMKAMRTKNDENEIIIDACKFCQFAASSKTNAQDALDLMVRGTRYDHARMIACSRTRTDRILYEEADQNMKLEAALQLVKKFKWLYRNRNSSHWIKVGYMWPEGDVSSWNENEKNRLLSFASHLCEEMDYRYERVQTAIRTMMSA